MAPQSSATPQEAPGQPAPALGPADVRTHADARQKLGALQAEFAAALDRRTLLDPLNATTRKIIKSVLAVCAAVILGWMPANRLLTTTSAEAIVNSHVMTIRAPIQGAVSADARGYEIGSTFDAGDSILSINDVRVERMHLDALRRSRHDMQTLVEALDAKQRVLTQWKASLGERHDQFRQGRVDQLTRRLAEIDAQIKATRVQHEKAKRDLERAEHLGRSGFTSTVAVDKAATEEKVALEAVNGLLERRRAVEIELEAARAGTFVGDALNDTPQSAQKALDLTLELADVDVRLKGARRQLAEIDTDLSAERERHVRQSTTTVSAKFRARVWEVMTRPGEHVNAGQDLLRVLDCSTTIVTASVSESAYQKLVVGQKALFKARAGGAALPGTIVGLNGLAAVATGSAIQQSALIREPFHVTLRFPGLAEVTDCSVGRTGLVTFDTSTPPPPRQTAGGSS